MNSHDLFEGANPKVGRSANTTIESRANGFKVEMRTVDGSALIAEGVDMTKHYTANHSFNRPSTGSIRKATFDQRKSDYLGNTNDRPAVFIEPSKKHNDTVRPSKNMQN